MDRNIYQIVALSFLFFTLHSCEYDCLGFPEEYDKYISYELNDSITYTNGTDSLNFLVIDYLRTEPSTFKGIVMDYDCLYEKYYKTDVQNGYYIKEYFEKNYGILEDGILISFTENDEFGLLGPNNFTSNNFEYSQVEYYQNFNFNGNEYNEVLFILKDTINSNPKIGYVLKANPGGILEFYDFQTKDKWRITN